MSQAEFFQQLESWIVIEVSSDLSGIHGAVERGDVAVSEEITEVGSENMRISYEDFSKLSN